MLLRIIDRGKIPSVPVIIEWSDSLLKGKTVVLGVTGSIAAYKIATLASALVKKHADVHVIMTKNATNFINPITFETLTKHKCIVDTFDREFDFSVKHISLAKAADIFMIAPASANVIGKLASGIADDMLTTTVMATRAPVYISPAMNTNMYENPIVQDNLKKLSDFGYRIIEPDSGFLACRDEGRGKMPDPDELLSYIVREIAYEKDMAGKKVLVTAGGTREAIDPVRYITNHSTGKMGYAIARAAMLRGAIVTLISTCEGSIGDNLMPPGCVKQVSVSSAGEMYEAVTKHFPDNDILIMAAAVADYRPKNAASDKIKKSDGDMAIELERTDDILASVSAKKREDQFICGFSMETKDMVDNSRKKLIKKNLDMIAANNLKQEGAGFATDTNIITIITRQSQKELPLMSKDEAAMRLLDAIMESQK